ncbi:hypothetical protein Tco_1543117, partial [Tanacetum coccineum]
MMYSWFRNALIIHRLLTYQAPAIHQPPQASFQLMDSGMTARIQDRRDMVQTVQGRQTQGYAGSRVISNATGSSVNINGGTSTTAPSASDVLMAKISSYDSNILLEVLTHENCLDNHVIDQSVQEMQCFERPIFNNDTDIDITSDSNMISYEQYLKETENEIVKDTSSSSQQDALISVLEE